MAFPDTGGFKTFDTTFSGRARRANFDPQQGRSGRNGEGRSTALCPELPYQESSGLFAEGWNERTNNSPPETALSVYDCPSTVTCLLLHGQNA
jgi:hypothetical protein